MNNLTHPLWFSVFNGLAMKVDIFGWHQELSEGISSIKLDFWQHRTMKRITPDVASFKVRINGYASRNALWQLLRSWTQNDSK